MASNKTAFAVGIFLIIGLSTGIVTIIWLGMSNFLDKGRNYVAYFDESVQGLDKDSSVKYRGVGIGRVADIRVAQDSTLIEVLVSIESALDPGEGMVAQLKSVGITGIMFIELDRKGKDEPDRSPEIKFEPEHPVIATKPSELNLFLNKMETIMKQVQALDMHGISERLKSAVSTIQKSVEDAHIDVLSSDIRASLDRLNQMLDPEKWELIFKSLEKSAASFDTLAKDAGKILTSLDRNLDRLVTSADKTILDIDKTVLGVDSGITDIRKLLRGIGEQADQAMKELNTAIITSKDFLGEGTGFLKKTDARFASFQRLILATLQNVEKMSLHMNHIMDMIADQPSQLIFGQPPPSRDIGRSMEGK